MKTKGQRLYEFEHPKYLTVVRVSDKFHQHPFEVLNPEHCPEWHLLTDKCQQEYERRAGGHSMFSERPT